MWCGVMFILSRHLALRNEPHAEAERSEEPLIGPAAGLEKPIFHKHKNTHSSEQPVYKTTHKKESITASVGGSAVDSSSEVRLPSDRTDNSNGSYDEDTTSESGSEGDTPPDSSDSLNTYYLAPEESERDLNTQDRDGKTLTITPSFNLLMALSSASGAVEINTSSGDAVGEGEEDYADFVVLDENYNRSGDTQTEQGRETDDTFLKIDPLCAVYEVEERHLNDEGMRRRAHSSHKKTEKSSRKSYKVRREKRSSDNLSEAVGMVTAAVSQKDLLNSIRRAHSTVKLGSKKFPDTWMSKINGTENGRPLMFRVGSTCMTMSNLVNENRERSTKNEEYKK